MPERSRRNPLASGLAAHGPRSVIIGGALRSRTSAVPMVPHELGQTSCALGTRSRPGVENTGGVR
jgi:hypothetical protein